jgi:hypothetical protein
VTSPALLSQLKKIAVRGLAPQETSAENGASAEPNASLLGRASDMLDMPFNDRPTMQER